MASVFKIGKAKTWTIEYSDENGDRHRKAGFTDKKATQALGVKLEQEAKEIKNGMGDRKAMAYRDHEAKPLDEHMTLWAKSLEAKGATVKHVELFASRARRVVAIMMGAKLVDIEPARNSKHADLPKFEVALTKSVATARLSDLTADGVQDALATLKREGKALATCNHHRAAIKAFSKWCDDAGRAREDVLRGVTGFNAKEDRRHDRRTVSIEELHKLIEAAERGPVSWGMTGGARALSYRLAAATGLRYSEIRSITPESFDWEAPSVTVAACYTKNGDPATLSLPKDMVDDLRAFVATIEHRAPVFLLPEEKGAKMLRVDLKAAGIPYRDAAGLVFDFHSLRCEMATLADAAGVSRGVIQGRMRHSSSQLTDRYIRPRLADIDSAADRLPSLKPVEAEPEVLEATGTDGRAVQNPATVENTDGTTAYACNSNDILPLGKTSGGLIIRRSGVRVASPVIKTSLGNDWFLRAFCTFGVNLVSPPCPAKSASNRTEPLSDGHRMGTTFFRGVASSVPVEAIDCRVIHDSS
jgi:integrase